MLYQKRKGDAAHVKRMITQTSHRFLPLLGTRHLSHPKGVLPAGNRNDAADQYASLTARAPLMSPSMPPVARAKADDPGRRVCPLGGLFVEARACTPGWGSRAAKVVTLTPRRVARRSAASPSVRSRSARSRSSRPHE